MSGKTTEIRKYLQPSKTVPSFTKTRVTICFLLPLYFYNTIQNYDVQRKWAWRGEKKDYLQQFCSPPFA